jgi:hypothetical protein
MALNLMLTSLYTQRVYSATIRKNEKINQNRKKTLLTTILQRKHWNNVKEIAFKQFLSEQARRDEIWFASLPPFPKSSTDLTQLTMIMEKSNELNLQVEKKEVLEEELEEKSKKIFIPLRTRSNSF